MRPEPQPGDGPSAATDDRAHIALRTALAMLVPLARWLVRNGVHYASFAPALKSVFVEAARRELASHGSKITDSALSVLSGVHRRDIRAIDPSVPAQARPKSPSVASQLVTRWLTDPALRGRDDQPRALPRLGDGQSFDALARQVSSDVHPRTLLDEMLRLGLLALDGDTVRLQAQAFVPREGFDEMAVLMRDNVSDHLAAAAHNMTGAREKFLEQSIFGSGLAPRSTDQLGQLARKLWKQAFQQMAAEAGPLLKQDARSGDGSMRMRFGTYFFAEPVDRATETAAAAPARDTNDPTPPAAPRRARATSTKTPSTRRSQR